MAFGRLERTPASQPMSDINMTPLIDVMLVLLVIFMITAPLMTSSLKMELPRTAAAQPNDGGPALALGITADGKVHVGDDAVSQADLVPRSKPPPRRIGAPPTPTASPKTRPARSSTPARCCRTRAASCTWATCATTRSTTCSRASCA
jgi:hypothetical protein